MNNIDGFFNVNFDLSLFYDAIEKSTDDYIFVVKIEEDISLVTENMVRDFALPGRLIEGLMPVWASLIHPDDLSAYSQTMDDLVTCKTPRHYAEYRVLNRQNEWVWVRCKGVLSFDENQRPVLFVAVMSVLRTKGKMDYTTGLFTRSECEKHLDYIFSKQEESSNGGLILLGLDNFTRINDLNNHTFGDSVLRNFAQNVQIILPSNATIYHFDGDEFAIVAENCNKEEIDKLYSRIYSYTNRHHEVDGQRYYCTASAGVALCFVDADNSLDLIKDATYALEVSKNTGKNQCTYFSHELLYNKAKTLKLTELLQESVLNLCKGFRLAYQPQVDARTLEIQGAEALIRWSSSEYDFASPTDIIPILEENGLIVSVGKWIFENAIKTTKLWLNYHPDFVISINISYMQLLDDSFNDFLIGILEKYDFSTKHLVLELTESCMVIDMEHLKNEFSFLRGLGIDIAMDDFGTGYSSLGLLAESPADVIKIDRVFAAYIEKNDFNRTFIKMVIQLCHSINLHVCMEGVERVEELNALREMKADTVQGYYISKPLEEEEFFNKYIKTN